ncbi:POT family-domain-containing protein [Gilbertella persicaria]|uniref:POT family-domain-containing protein n=1 Tax=Gilbertella persicaria TaxID=101096 RepID=UPI0022208C1F|nr:POT family-domain-containing protein [Gilbertella persicaria]KAI8092202.1 POT family-domain-containing protein [Gilbertella persicaria]
MLKEEDKKFEANFNVTTQVEFEANDKEEKYQNTSNLRRVAEGVPIAAWFIIINEFCERFAYYGGSTPFQNYVQNGPMDDPAGQLNRGQSTATALQNFFTFFCYFTPMLGAIVADQYIGRYWTIIIFSIIYMVGWLILTTTSIPVALESGAGFPGYIVSLVVIGFGTGGIKGIVSPLCADQYRRTENYVKELKSGELVMVDYDLSIQHLYNWFYWAINVGSLLGGIICPLLENHVGFYAAFLLPTCMFAIAIIVFIAGTKLYYKPAATTSVILKAWDVIRFANKQAKLPENKEARKQCKDVLDFAKRDSELPAVSEWTNEADQAASKWDDTFVDELKQAVMACKIFVPLSIYWVCYNNLSNNLISQAGVMARPDSLPNDIMNNFDPIALIIFIPITDMLFYPMLRRFKIQFASQMRITVGFFLGCLSMVYAAVVQYYIYKDPLFISSGGEASNVSVFIQIPCYFLIAFSEIFASITSMEYAYTHAPKSMKSLVSALSLWPNCVAALISLAISPSAHDPNMVWVYTGVACGSFVVGCLYYYLFAHYDTLDEEYRIKKLLEQDNMVPEVIAEAEAEALEKLH